MRNGLCAAETDETPRFFETAYDLGIGNVTFNDFELSQDVLNTAFSGQIWGDMGGNLESS